MFGRSVVLAVVLAAATAVPGCGKDAATAVTVVPGQRAGVVREVAGTVTASRNGAERTLAVGDEVSGDDEIQTGADGSVLIELDHNHVTFTLPASKTQRVAASLAWTQPMATAAAATDEQSAAAGRAIEKSAVDTAASSNRPSAGGGAPQAQAPQAAQVEAAKLDRAGGEGGGGSGTDHAIIGGTPGSGSAPLVDRKPKNETDGMRRQPQDPPPPPNVDPVTGTPGPGSGVDEKELDDSEDKDVPEVPKPPGGPSLGIAVEGGLTVGEVAAKIAAKDLTGCWRHVPASVTITLAVHSAGMIDKVTSTDAAAAKCLTRKLATVKFAARRASTKVTLTLSR